MNEIVHRLVAARHLRICAFTAVLVQVACASSSASTPGPNEPVPVMPAELARLQAEAARVGPLQSRIAELERQKAALEAEVLVGQQRLGLAPFQPTSLAATDFTLKLADATKLDAQDGRGRKQSLARALADTQHGALIAFWATWCVPCTSPEELARLKGLRTTLATQGVDVLFFAVDELAKVQSDPRAATWLYPLWQRNQGHLDMLPEAFVRAQGVDLPLMLLVTKTGRIQWVRRGALDDDAVRDIVTAFIRAAR